MKLIDKYKKWLSTVTWPAAVVSVEQSPRVATTRNVDFRAGRRLRAAGILSVSAVCLRETLPKFFFYFCECSI